ncbi:MAG: hypothetical protein LBV44_00805 [Methylobacillus sp.]|jgi:type IV pilus assembly protein PilY1|nr:hypothetical protein [Methylobacillus sp.]
MRPKSKLLLKRSLSASLISTLVFQGMMPLTAQAATLTQRNLAQEPLSAIGDTTPNVLMVMDVSNSMDQAPDGSPSWSGDVNSKAHIARTAAKKVIADYGDKMNLGLMAYQQKTATLTDLFTMYRDISFNSALYPAGKNSRRLQPFTNNGTYFYYNSDMISTAYISGLPRNSFYFWSPNNQNSYFTLQANQTSDDPVTSITGCAPNTYLNGLTTGQASALPGFYAGGIYYGCMGWGGVDGGVGGMTLSWLATIYLGETWLSDIVSNAATNQAYSKGYLHVPIGLAPAGSAQASQLNLKLSDPRYPTTTTPTDTSTWVSTVANPNTWAASGITSNNWNNPSLPLENGGATPIEGTLQTANSYFNGSLTTAEGKVSTTTFPSVGGKCTKNFVVFLTDGLPSVRPDGTSAYQSVSQATFNANVVAEAEKLRNLKADGTIADSSRTSVASYWIGFGTSFANGSAALNSFAAAGGTSSAEVADNPAKLAAAFSKIFSNISTQVTSVAAVAANSGSVSDGTLLYQAMYDPNNWSGDLLGKKTTDFVNATGVLTTTVVWSAADKMPAYSSRNLATWDPNQKKGAAWTWSDVQGAGGLGQALQKDTNAAEAQKLLAYLGGDTSNEGTATGKYRPRAGKKLGDIINSAPVYVSQPKSGYKNSMNPTCVTNAAACYSNYVSTNANRTGMVYVGANDGFLHAFDASSGIEQWAYMPAAVFPTIKQLTAQSYTHRFYVDGNPVPADAFIKTPGNSTAHWSTVLVGGLNAGGQGIYALDVTTTTGAAKDRVMWEFGDHQTGAGASATKTYDQDMGYSYSQPSIVKTANGKWAAIFGNGYNNTESDGYASTSGDAVLYVVDLETGVLMAKLDTGIGYAADPAGKPNGLSTPAVVDVNKDGIADYVYAGDLQGNMWKFDLTDASASNWKIAYGCGSDPTAPNGCGNTTANPTAQPTTSPKPLFTAKTASGGMQSITTMPQVGRHPSGNGYLVYFGTGKYFEVADNALNTIRNSFYGIWDKNIAVANGRSDLQGQAVTGEYTAGSPPDNFRATTSNPVAASKYGWYIDLPKDYERLVTNPVLYDQRIMFSTWIPASGDCEGGGTGWFMALNAATGSFGGAFVKDTTAGGMQITQGTPSSPTILNGATTDKAIIGAGGEIIGVDLTKAGGNRRVSWRDLMQQSQ